VDVIELGLWLDFMILKVLSNPNDFMVLYDGTAILFFSCTVVATSFCFFSVSLSMEKQDHLLKHAY